MYPSPYVSIVFIFVSLVTVSPYGTSASVSTVVAPREVRSIVKPLFIRQSSFVLLLIIILYTVAHFFSESMT